MGSIISKIYDDYEDYEWLAKHAGVEPVGIRDDISFYRDAERIIEEMSPKLKNELKNGYIYQKFKK